MPTVLEPNAPLPPASSPAALVSVLMPAFNAGQYLGESVQSILDQTYPHFELLILDDGSSDDTYAIAKSFGDVRIRVLRHEYNQGLVITRNDLVKAAQGKYIAFFRCRWHCPAWPPKSASSPFRNQYRRSVWYWSFHAQCPYWQTQEIQASA